MAIESISNEEEKNDYTSRREKIAIIIEDCNTTPDDNRRDNYTIYSGAAALG